MNLVNVTACYEGYFGCRKGIVGKTGWVLILEDFIVFMKSNSILYREESVTFHTKKCSAVYNLWWFMSISIQFFILFFYYVKQDIEMQTVLIIEYKQCGLGVIMDVKGIIHYYPFTFRFDVWRLGYTALVVVRDISKTARPVLICSRAVRS